MENRVEILNKITELEPIFVEKREAVDKQMYEKAANARDSEKMKVVEICRLIEPDKNVEDKDDFHMFKTGYKSISEYLGYEIKSDNLESFKFIIREINLLELE